MFSLNFCTQIGQLGIRRLNWDDIGDPCMRSTSIQVLHKAELFPRIRWPTQTVSFVLWFFSLWWPCFVLIFYILSVIPTLIAKRSMQSSLSGTTPCFEFAIFLTMGFVVCSFALPIVLSRADVVNSKQFPIFESLLIENENRQFQIKIGACILTLCGNIVVYLTILGYFLFLDPDENATYGGMAWLL